MKHVIPVIVGVFFITTGALAQVQFYGPTSQSPNELTAQDFETANNIYDAEGADDFIVPNGVTWYIDSIEIPGNYYCNNCTFTTVSGLNLGIYNDNSGEPGTLVYDTVMNSDVDYNGDGDLLAIFENPLQLPAGHYWLVASARKDYGTGGGQWGWNRDTALTGYPALWKNPLDGFSSGCTSWIEIYNCSALGMADSGFAFSVFGCYGPKPIYGAPLDTSICAGQEPFVTISADTAGPQTNVTYLWNTSETTMSINAATAGNYTVYAEDAVTLCGLERNIHVDIVDVLQPELMDTSLCEEELPVIYQGPSNTGCSTCIRVWPDSTANVFYPVYQGGEVTLTIYDTESGCSKSDTAFVDVDTSHVTIVPGSFNEICNGEKVTFGTIENMASYSWLFDDGLGFDSISNEDTVSVSQAGLVLISATTSEGCIKTDTAEIVVYPLPVPLLSASTLPSGKVKITVNSGFVGYEWSNGSTNEDIVVGKNGKYTVTVTNQFGCEGSATYQVTTAGVEPVAAMNFSLYPNPSSDVIELTVPDLWSGKTTVSIRDMTGKLVHTSPLGQSKLSINISSLSAGQYVLECESPEGLGQKVFVISR